MYGIYRNPFRVFINNFSWTITTGYGNTSYRHDLAGFYYYQDFFNQAIRPVTQETLPQNFTGTSNWLNDPVISDEITTIDPFEVPFNRLNDPVNNPLLQNDQVLINTDTTELGFKGGMSSIPINLSVHYDFQDFRIGLGWSYERQWIRELKPTNFENRVRAYTPDFTSTRFTRLYGLLGYKFYQFWYHDFVAELQVGRLGYGPEFTGVDPGIYFNLGVSIEQNLSEYFRIIIRPAYDIKSYTINLPEGGSIRHNHNTFFIQAGISINIPEIPRSPIKSDHVQLKHVITDPATGRLMEVRGQPFWKRQNPKVGENHRRLWRYKLKNRRKMNPY